MTLETRWIVSASASGLHAAAALLAGATVVDPALVQTLGPAATALGGVLSAAGIEPSQFLTHAVPLSVRLDTPAALAEVTLTKLLGPGGKTLAPAVARALVALQQAFAEARPHVLEELELRSEPLRLQWEARGPGLLAALGRLTERELLVETADIILVQPVLGGGGASHWAYNSVSLEAVLANPLPELPEVVRLGWLLAQLNLDLPGYSEQLPRPRLAQIGPLALVTPILAAAEEVELARCDERTVSACLTHWQLPMVQSGTLVEWWETYQAAKPPWAVALGALERMLSREPSGAGC